MRHHDPQVRAAVLADYAAGMSQKLAGQTHGVSESTVSGWVRAAGISRTYRETIRERRKRKKADTEAELALTGGRWVLDPVRRVQRWVR